MNINSTTEVQTGCFDTSINLGPDRFVVFTARRRVYFLIEIITAITRCSAFHVPSSTSEINRRHLQQRPALQAAIRLAAELSGLRQTNYIVT